MTKKPRAVAYWLLPETAAHEMLAEKIRELAMRLEAPVFAPHVSVFVAPENSRHLFRIGDVFSMRLSRERLQFFQVHAGAKCFARSGEYQNLRRRFLDFIQGIHEVRQ